MVKIKVQRDLFGEKVKQTREEPKEPPKQRSSKLLGLILSPQKNNQVPYPNFLIMRMHEVTNHEKLDKYLKLDKKERKRLGLGYWFGEGKKIKLRLEEEIKKTKKIKIQPEIVPTSIYPSPSGPTKKLYDEVMKRFKDASLEEKKKLFEMTMHLSIPRILEPPSNVRLIYIFGHMIGFAYNDGILDKDSTNDFMNKLELNLYGYFTAMNKEFQTPRTKWDNKTKEKWNKITKAWENIKRQVLGP